MQIDGVENECLISITARKGFFVVTMRKKLIGNFSHFHSSYRIVISEIHRWKMVEQKKLLMQNTL